MNDVTTSPAAAADFLEGEMRTGFLHAGVVAPGSRAHAALLAVIRAARVLPADVWDAGFDAGYDRVLVEQAQRSNLDLRQNPYREEQNR